MIILLNISELRFTIFEMEPASLWIGFDSERFLYPGFPSLNGTVLRAGDLMTSESSKKWFHALVTSTLFQGCQELKNVWVKLIGCLHLIRLFHPKSCIPESPIEICFCCQRDAPLVQHRPSFARHYVVCMSDVPSGERWCAGMSCNIHDGQKVKDHDRAIAGWVLNLAADTVVGYF